jgi:RHS repeat-associated protein
VPPIEAKFKDVACKSSTMCLAVGEDKQRGRVLGQLWNGSKWENLLGEATYEGTRSGISCTSTTWCMVVGTTGTKAIAERWQSIAGTWVPAATWYPEAPSGGTEPTLSAISCTSTKACTAVGSYRKEGVTKTLAEAYNGSWSVQSTPNPESGTAALGGVSCDSSTSCAATGGSYAMRWNGSAWSATTLATPAGATSFSLPKVSCFSGSLCVAVGYYKEAAGKESPAYRKTLAEKWNGSSWSVLSTPNPSEAKGDVEFLGVSCPTSSACFGVGRTVTALSEGGLASEAKALAESWNGSSWSIQETPKVESRKEVRLNAVSCSAASECGAVGSAGVSSLETGETVPLAERWYEKDTTPPDTSITSGPSGSSNNPNPSFSFEATEINSSFECKLDAGSWGSCTIPKAYSSLADGSHSFEVRATDSSGNLDSTPAQVSWTIDTVAPQTTITSPRPSYTSHEEPPITFTSNESGSTFKCSLDGAAYASCTSPYTLPANLDGTTWHTFAVVATDSATNVDATPAEWKFNLGIYPASPSTSKMASPEEGRVTSHYFTLASEWGSAPEGGGVSGVTYQIKLGYWKEFKTIPAEYVLNGQGQAVSWPLPVSANPGQAEPLFFNYTGAVKAKGWSFEEEDIKLRAIFDGGIKAAGASKPVAVEYAGTYGGVGSPTDAIESIGPASVDLLTGQYTLGTSDVSIPIPGSEASLEFSRTYESNFRNQKVASMVLGGMWQPSAPVEQTNEEAWRALYERHEDAVPAEYDPECIEEWEEEGKSFPQEECMIEEALPEANWIELIDSEGGEVSFEISGGKYIAPEYMQEYVLTKHGEGASTTYELVEPEGIHTVFTKNEVGTVGSYSPTSVSWQASGKSARLVYEHPGGTGEMRLAKMIAPAPAGVTCTDTEATKTAGCRTLTFQYFSCSCGGWSRLESITYYNSSGNEAQKQVVAKYEYDANYRLIAEWDPRISPALKTAYGYGAWGSSKAYKMLSLTPPGEEPWGFAYYETGFYERFPLASVSRASLLKSPSTATTTLAYGVPLSGEGAPYDMSAKTVATWGQTDYPVDATAVFPATEVPGEKPSDYNQATVHYMDPEGYEVNTAAAAPPSVEGSSITTFETDMYGDVVRELGAQARLEALKAKEPAVRSHELDSHSTYSSDGTEMLESWGPLHKVRLQSGETAEARTHATIKYDEGFKPTEAEVAEGAPTPRLPTKETIAAVVPGKEGELEPQVTKTNYNWELRKPTEEITDPEGLNLIAKTVYSSAGQVIEERQPADTEGKTAGTTKTEYYVAGGSLHGSCESHPEWAGLPCKTYPVADPSPAGSRPKMPQTSITKYSSLDQPEEVQETTGGVLKRTTTATYDAAGRSIKSKITGEGTSIPTVATTYNEKTGAPESQYFVCEAPEKCEGFDSQQVRTTYDALGRPIEYEDADGNKSGVAYDLLGRPVIATDGKGTQVIAYDEKSGVATKLEDSAAGTFLAAYNADGQMTEQLLPDGLNQKISYDSTGAATSLKYVKESYCSSSCTWLEFNREDSIGGQVLGETSTLGTDEYSYDKAGRLTLAKETPAGEGCTTRAYAFDKDSNRLSKTVRAPKAGACDTESAGTKTSYEYDTADRLINEGVEYDYLGRITALPSAYAGGGKLTTSYYINNLTRSQTQEGLTNTYYLDASLRQRESVQSGTKSATEVFHYTGGSDSPAWTQEGSNWSRNISALGGGLGAIQKSSGETTLQLGDMHGDVIASTALAPTETKPISTQRFDEFGNPLQSGFLKGGSAEYGWLGISDRRTQLPSGVIQMGKRSYVPAMGRFLTPDPVKGGSANSYDYANQDPINNFDLTGEATSCTKKRGNCHGHPTENEYYRKTHHLLKKNHLREPVGGCHGRGSCQFYRVRGGADDPVSSWLTHAASNVANYVIRHEGAVGLQHFINEMYAESSHLGEIVDCGRRVVKDTLLKNVHTGSKHKLFGPMFRGQADCVIGGLFG